jgi:peptidyl-dipeptidase Dcp
LNLNPEQTTLLDENIKVFSKWSQSYGRQKTKLREIDKELSKTSLQFGENVLAETQAFQMHLRTKRLIRLTRRHDRNRSFLKSQEKEGWILL